MGLTTLFPPCADCLEILAASTSWSRKGLFRLIKHSLTGIVSGTEMINKNSMPFIV